MKCPHCKEHNLVISERQGIEIDYCPECRGVWLDRGELDKILERSAKSFAPERDLSSNTNLRSEDYGRRDEQRYGKYPKRRKSFLEELFD